MLYEMARKLYVSILVLMEVKREMSSTSLEAVLDAVSILVLMEVKREPSALSGWGPVPRFQSLF